LASVEVVVGLLVPVRFSGFGLIVGIEDHPGEGAGIAAFTPPPRGEHRTKTVGASARRWLAFESRLEPRDGAAQHWEYRHMFLLTFIIICNGL
jgi:hypothetical protein